MYEGREKEASEARNRRREGMPEQVRIAGERGLVQLRENKRDWARESKHLGWSQHVNRRRGSRGAPTAHKQW